MKDGKSIAIKGAARWQHRHRHVELPRAGQPAKLGDFGSRSRKSSGRISRAATASHGADLIIQGKAADAIAQLEPVVKYYEPFARCREAGGRLRVLKAHALASLGRDKEAEPIAEQTSNGDRPRDVRGECISPRPPAQELARAGARNRRARNEESKRPGTLARASIIKGECLLVKKEWDDAVVPFSKRRSFTPAKNGDAASDARRGRAQFGMEFSAGARDARRCHQDLRATPEAAQAQAELERSPARKRARPGKMTVLITSENP